ncbi:MAG: AraC family transcriptional regulator [Oscillospiraceae bacterium]
MEQNEVILAVRRMQNFIDTHLAEPITLTQLSRAAGYSPWHSERLFKEYIGKAPFDYIRSLRLTKAALVLRDSKAKVIDVAFDFVFDSHEGFTKAFSKEFGLPPKNYAMTSPPIQLFMPYPANDYRHTKFKGEKTMQESKKISPVFVQVVERPARKALVRRGVNAADYFTYCEEVGCEIWGLLTSVKEALYEPIGMWLPAGMRKGASEYIQGVELPLDYCKPVPEGYELTEFPPCKIMVFQGPPYNDDDFEEAINELWEFISTFDPKLYGYEWAVSDGPRFQLAPMGYRGYIEARPVRPLNK